MADTSSSTSNVNLMEKLVSLCKRRGFIYPASEIYGGLNGFWDYGPLGVLLKNNIRDWWWRNMVECPPLGPDGHPLDMVGVDTAIIQNPKTWLASGHVGGFSDPMVDCRACKARFRADHLVGVKVRPPGVEKDLWFSGMGTLEEIREKNKKLRKLLEALPAGSAEPALQAVTALSPEQRALVPCPECGEVG